MKTKISLLFYLKKPKSYQKGPVPIYARIRVESKRAEFTTGRECEPVGGMQSQEESPEQQCRGEVHENVPQDCQYLPGEWLDES